jgi:hypothetical protein
MQTMPTRMNVHSTILAVTQPIDSSSNCRLMIETITTAVPTFAMMRRSSSSAPR